MLGARLCPLFFDSFTLFPWPRSGRNIFNLNCEVELPPENAKNAKTAAAEFHPPRGEVRQVLDCGSPLPLWRAWTGYGRRHLNPVRTAKAPGDWRSPGRCRDRPTTMKSCAPLFGFYAFFCGQAQFSDFMDFGWALRGWPEGGGRGLTGGLRGGSWGNNNPDNLRAANRNHNEPGNRNHNVGFRLVGVGESRKAEQTENRRDAGWGTALSGQCQEAQPNPGGHAPRDRGENTRHPPWPVSVRECPARKSRRTTCRRQIAAGGTPAGQRSKATEHDRRGGSSLRRRVQARSSGPSVRTPCTGRRNSARFRRLRRLEAGGTLCCRRPAGSR